MAMTTTETPAMPDLAERDAEPGAGERLRGPRGRHRRPRPRKVLLMAGGLALAAGVLGLVRLSPDSGVGGLGTAEAEPSADPYADTGADTDIGTDTGTDRSTNAAATFAAAPPTPTASATPVMSGPSALPTPSVPLSPTPAVGGRERQAPAGTVTTVPDAPNPPGTPAPAPPSPSASTGTTPRPAPTPTPSRTTPTPEPRPDRPGLCLPIVAVCVDPLGARHD